MSKGLQFCFWHWRVSRLSGVGEARRSLSLYVTIPERRGRMMEKRNRMTLDVAAMMKDTGVEPREGESHVDRRRMMFLEGV